MRNGPDTRTRDDSRGQQVFVAITLLSCLVLQRFALPAGAAPLSVAAPIVGMTTLWFLAAGVLTIDRNRFAIMLGLAGIALIAVDFRVSMPIAMVTRTSFTSLLYWLGITAFAILRFAEPMDERVFYSIFIRCLAVIAICGLAAFLAQFVGLQMFSFKDWLPKPFSMEPYYNEAIPLGETSFMKANGFFLLEPSIFSQFMALGLICEWLNQKRMQYITLFLLALFCSASGTGWLVVGAFVFYTACVKGGRGLAMALIFSLVCILGFLTVALAFPELAGSIVGRMGEINMQGTSGNERFVTPFMVLEHVLQATPRAFFTGIGPGGADADLVGITYDYSLNTPVKVLLEYGVFGLLSYLALILCNHRTPRQNWLILPALVLLLFGGANDHFPPIMFPVLLLTTVLNGPPRDRSQAPSAAALQWR